MDYILTDQQQEIRKLVRSFMEKKVKPYINEYERDSEFPVALHKEAFEIGLHGFEIPREFGGTNVGYKTSAVIYEELGKIDAGFALTICATNLALKPVLISGTQAQKALFSRLILEGGYASFGLTEPNAGSDAASISTVAVRDGDEYVLNGSKCFITNGAYANVYTILALTDPSKGARGLTAFIVERDRTGISVGKEEDKMGIRTSNTVEVVLQDVRVPVENRLGEEGQGFKIAMKTLDISRPFVGNIAVGMAQRALDEAVAYAKQRVTFGQPIANYQAIQFMLADMAIKVDTARQMCVHAVDLLEAGLPMSKEAAIAKCYSTDILVDVASDAIQVLGGYGYMKEYPVEKILRDSKIFQIFEGTNQIQRMVVSGALLK